MKSYNSRALAGEAEYDDKQFQSDMKDMGISIPDKLLYTSEMNDFVLDQVRSKAEIGLQQQVNPLTGNKYTESEAKQAAENRYKTAKSRLDGLQGKK